MTLIVVARHAANDIARWRDLERQDAVHATSVAFRRRVARAADAANAFIGAGPCYAGTSWGKDSTVLAHLLWLLSERHGGMRIPLVWVRVDPVENPHCLLVRDAFLAAHPRVAYDEIVVSCPRDASGNWVATGRLRDGFALARSRYGVRHISGVRASESGVRSLRMRRWGESTVNTCAPMGWWSAADVFAYLHAHELPVHPAYAMTHGGLWDRDRIRVASIGGGRGTGHGRAEWERRYYPEMTKLCRAR